MTKENVLKFLWGSAKIFSFRFNKTGLISPDIYRIKKLYKNWTKLFRVEFIEIFIEFRDLDCIFNKISDNIFNKSSQGLKNHIIL